MKIFVLPHAVRWLSDCDSVFYNNNEKMLYPQDKSCQPLENFRIRYKTILEPHSIGHLRRNTK